MAPSRMPLSSRALFVLSSVVLIAGSFLADYFSPTHIFNLEWPPHAKFHTGQTLSFSVLLGFATVFFAFRRTTDRSLTILSCAVLASAYWLTQASAILYPGTDFWDPGHAGSLVFGVLAPQLVVDLVQMLVIGAACLLAVKRKWT